MSGVVRVGTRGSALALWQTNWVINQLRMLEPDREFEIIRIKTQGDLVLDVSLNKIGGKGLFTKEIENSLLENQIDLAVHSLKDLPTELPPGLMIGAISRREDARDALVSANGEKLGELPLGASIGTSSLRRGAQLLNHRPDLDIRMIRGNVETRLRKLTTEKLNAVVMAAAGLVRLGLVNRISEFLSFEVSLPAVGQGALGIEIRDGDEATAELVGKLNHPETETAAKAERALLRRLGGGCQVPIGALGEISDGGRLSLHAMVASPDGNRVVRSCIEGAVSESEILGLRLAEKLIEMGAEEILRQVQGCEVPPGGA